MRVLLVGTGAYPIPPPGYGGVERVIHEYSEALQRAGHSVQIINEAHGPGALSEYRFSWRVPHLVRQVPHDVVHASTPVVANRLAAAGIPYIYTTHSRHWFWRASWRHSWGYRLERRAVRRALATVALTKEVDAAIRAAVPGLGPAATRVIPFGFDATGYGAAKERRTGTRALGVGIVLPLKRWHLAAAALKGTGLQLRIVGPTPEPSYAEDVRKAGDLVELLGEVDGATLKAIYAESDFLIHPSRVEVLPRAVLEGMASALPVIGAEPIASLFPEGRGGWTAPPKATDAETVQFIRQSAEWLARDTELRRRMGAEAQASVAERYSWDRVVAAHVELYREAAGAPP